MDNFSWQGAAGISVNDKNEILMVLQAASGEEKKWTVPSGTLEEGESFEECCIREIWEETGLTARVLKEVHSKSGMLADYGISYYVKYYTVEIVSGEITIQDPDEFIHEIAWKSLEEIEQLSLAYPEDIEIIRSVIG